MIRQVLRKLCLLATVACAFAVMSGEKHVSGQGSANPCGMQLNQAPVIFCDTFDQPHPVNSRSGQLNGVLWGVSRLQGRGNGVWKNSTLDGCNGPQAASAANASDVIICNGQLRESMDDDHDVAVLAMYPKQPFDFAGRTGTISFDVTNDTTGSHGAWPEFWLTDLPVPAPMTHFNTCDLCSAPKNAIGIRFAADVPGWRVDSVVVVRNWVLEDHNLFENNTTGFRVIDKGWVSQSSGPNGGLNHVEIRMSQNKIDVYASEPGSKTLKLVTTVENLNSPITRGLIWIQDVHYAAAKAADDGGRANQQNHTYTWDNVAFDGPPTYRDLSFDVRDNTVSLGDGNIKIGWDTTSSNPANLTTLPMTAQNISAATNAYLMFNLGAYPSNPATFNVTLNGHVNQMPNPMPMIQHGGGRTLALPVQLNQLVNGPQNIRLSANVPMTVQNVNVVLVAAAPVPGLISPNPPNNLRIIR